MLNEVVLSNSNLEQFGGRLGTVGSNPMCGSPLSGGMWVVAECVLTYKGCLFWAKP